jgi:hypothetical protein
MAPNAVNYLASFRKQICEKAQKIDKEAHIVIYRLARMAKWAI